MATSDVVVVDHYDSYTWNLVHLVAAVTGTLPTVLEHDQVTADEVLRFSHVVLSPGPGHPADPHDFAVGREVVGRVADDADVPVLPPRPGQRLAFKHLEHFHLRVVDGIRVIVAVHLFNVCLAFFVIEALDVILARLVQIDGLLVQRRQRRGKRNLRDDLRFGSNIHDHEIVAGDGP